jgi:hypothetical protein
MRAVEYCEKNPVVCLAGGFAGVALLGFIGAR